MFKWHRLSSRPEGRRQAQKVLESCLVTQETPCKEGQLCTAGRGSWPCLEFRPATLPGKSSPPPEKSVSPRCHGKHGHSGDSQGHVTGPCPPIGTQQAHLFAAMPPSLSLLFTPHTVIFPFLRPLFWMQKLLVDRILPCLQPPV